MIIFDRVTHYLRAQDPPILDAASFVLPANRRVACFGVRGSGRSTLVRLVSGQINQPKQGVISRGALRISFPVGPNFNVTPRNTVLQNLVDIARLHGFPQQVLQDFVVEHGDAEKLMMRRTNTLTASERSRLFCPIGYCMPFDYYVCDGDPFGAAQQYRARFAKLFHARIQGKGLFYMANSPRFVREYCDMGAVFYDRKVVLYEDINEAIRFYREVIKPIDEAYGGEPGALAS